MNNLSHIMICVTRQKNCERLIQEGYKIAAQTAGRLYILHVAGEGENYLGNPNESEALEYLFQVSKVVGAEMIVLRAKNVVKALVDFAKEQKISMIILGEPLNAENDNVIRALKNQLPGIKYFILPA